MRATVNGEPMELPEGLSVRDLLDRLKLGPAPVAVERNGSVVRRTQHGEVKLADGDAIEVVTFVGGG